MSVDRGLTNSPNQRESPVDLLTYLLQAFLQFGDSIVHAAYHWDRGGGGREGYLKLKRGVTSRCVEYRGNVYNNVLLAAV